MKAAADAAKVHFFSVKGNSSDENYNNDGATGDRALAVGVAAKAGGLKATALTGGNASGDFSFAVGNNAQAKGWGLLLSVRVLWPRNKGLWRSVTVRRPTVLNLSH